MLRNNDYFMMNAIYNDEVIAKVAIEKKKGLKIVLVNGCFDLIHIGHIKLLSEAKKAGDKLVVGVNTDESVKRLKGPNRPINTQDIRCEIISAIKYVDYVVLFDETTPSELIKKICPSVIYKGSEYISQKMEEETIINQIECEVRYIKQNAAYSSSNLIKRAICTGAEGCLET